PVTSLLVTRLTRWCATSWWRAHCPPITMKGISREVVPYAVEGMLDAQGQKVEVFSEHMTGLDFYLDPAMVTVGSAHRIRALLQKAITALERYAAPPA